MKKAKKQKYLSQKIAGALAAGIPSSSFKSIKKHHVHKDKKRADKLGELKHKKQVYD